MAYETQSQAITSSANYDISQAYKNYLDAQRNISQNMSLATSVRENISESLKSQYEQQYALTKAEEASELTELTTAYNKDVSEQQDKLLKYGEKLNKLERSMYEAAGITDLDSIFTNVGAGGLGYYETKDGETRLTTRGQQFIDKVLNAGIDMGDGNVTQFADYLYETDPELYEFYTQNLGDVRSLIGGLTPDDMRYDENEYDEKIRKENNITTIGNVNANEFKLRLGYFTDDKGNYYYYDPKKDNKNIPKTLQNITTKDKEIVQYNGHTYMYLANKKSWYEIFKHNSK